MSGAGTPAVEAINQLIEEDRVVTFLFRNQELGVALFSADCGEGDRSTREAYAVSDSVSRATYDRLANAAVEVDSCIHAR